MFSAKQLLEAGKGGFVERQRTLYVTRSSVGVGEVVARAQSELMVGT
ncbi:hypothetical protein OHS18_30925 [Amycolatopsis sp. NBC_00355]